MAGERVAQTGALIDNLVWLCVIGAVLLVVPFVTDFQSFDDENPAVDRQRLYRGVSDFFVAALEAQSDGKTGAGS